MPPRRRSNGRFPRLPRVAGEHARRISWKSTASMLAGYTGHGSAVLVLACFFCLARPLLAGVEISFPLDGHFRPGKFMPVHVVVNNFAADSITLKSDGA